MQNVNTHDNLSVVKINEIQFSIPPGIFEPGLKYYHECNLKFSLANLLQKCKSK